MKRAFLVLFLAAAMIVTSSACSSGNSSASASATPGSAPPAPSEQDTAPAAEGWKPESTVNIYVGASAGGGTDLMVRAIAQAYEEYFGVSFQVINAPGGGGGISMQQVWDAKHDGYTLCGIHEGMHSLKVTDSFPYFSDVWSIYMCAGSTPVLSVNKSSGITTFEQFLETAKGKTMNAGASTPTSVLGLSYAQLQDLVKGDGITFNFLSYEGSNPTNVGLLSGEVDFAITNYSEQTDYIASGDFIPLVALGAEPVEDPTVGTIPSIADFYSAYNDYAKLMQWWGIILPADCPEEVVASYDEAWDYVMQSEPVTTFIRSQNIGAYGYKGAEASGRCAELDRAFSFGLWDVGLAAHDPAEFSLSR